MSLVSLYKALGDESRLRLLAMLSRGFFSVQELTSLLGLSQSTISHHLKILSSAGMVRSRKEGTWVYYTLSGRDGRSADEQSLSERVVGQFLDLVEHDFSHDLVETLADDQGRVQTILNTRSDRTRDFFETVAQEWDSLRSEATGSPTFLEELLTHIPSHGALLELGCGTGVLLKKVAPRDGETIGVDFAPAMLNAARAGLGDRSSTVEFRLGQLEHLPVADESIDTAVGYMVFHHLPDPAQAMRDACRVLRPGGELLVVDLTRHNQEHMRDKFADLWLGFEPEEFCNWATQEGFSTTDVRLLGESSEAFLFKGIKEQ